MTSALTEPMPNWRALAASALAYARAVLFGIIGPDSLPPRVAAALVAQQRESEIIIGWLQMSAIFTFLALYTVAPKAFPPNIPFEPVPWTLGLYGAFTTFRLRQAYRGILGAAFLRLSVVVDMAVLLVTIWSFHLQYQAPPAIYLKAPTLMYVFILIALRALRFEPHYVVLAGLTAAAGWLVLVAYAVIGPRGAMLTHNYATYMTSYSVLLGAEFDKIISIFMVTAILALALFRARRLLITAIHDEIANRDLVRFFSPEVAARIKRSDSGIMAGASDRREAAILMIDLRGFTKLAHIMEPAALMDLLGEYQARVVPVIQRHGGSIDKYLGDGILASFGAVGVSKSHAADACRAVEALRSEIDAWRLERTARGLPAPDVGMALAAGPVLFGVVGHETRLEYTVIGDVVNLAAKLEKQNKREQVRALTTAETYDRALAQGYAPEIWHERRRARQVDGVGEVLDLVVLAPLHGA